MNWSERTGTCPRNDPRRPTKPTLESEGVSPGRRANGHVGPPPSQHQALEDFFAQSPLGLLWIAPDGRIQKVNAAQLQLLGKTASQCVGRCISEFFAQPAEALQALRRLSRKETLRDFHIRLRGPSTSSVRHVLIDANGFWERERLSHSRWFVRDITQRVELEREILTVKEREQQRLGRDLHDDLCQQLAGIEFLSETLAGSLKSASPNGALRAREIARMVREVMDCTRELARGLSPVELHAHGLPMALTELSARTRKVYGIHLSCRSDSVPVLENAVAIHLYRIAQEAVANAIKHGRATKIDIRLSGRDGHVILRVQDNGLGLPRRLGKRRGMGLRIMRYRCDVIGGLLSVERAEGGGTAVRCAVRTTPAVILETARGRV